MSDILDNPDMDESADPFYPWFMFKKASEEDHLRRERGELPLRRVEPPDPATAAEAAWWHRAEAEVKHTLWRVSREVWRKGHLRDVMAYMEWEVTFFHEPGDADTP